MTLELGLFLGAKAFGGPDQQAKRCLVLDETPYRYQTTAPILPDRMFEHMAENRTSPSKSFETGCRLHRCRRHRDPKRLGDRETLQRIAPRCRGWCEKLQLNPRRLTFGDDVALIVAWLRENASGVEHEPTPPQTTVSER